MSLREFAVALPCNFRPIRQHAESSAKRRNDAIAPQGAMVVEHG
jgi:hypothetical protein